jgi:sodium-independent sulfate anion transporter 11
VYRFEESYLYPNASIVNSALVDYVKENMRRGRDMSNVKLRDRPWNDPGPSRGGAAQDQVENEKKPVLYAIVLDFSTVSHMDTTATQALIDARTEIEKWADHRVEFHFATILSPWIRRALIAGGFGTGISASKIREVAAVVPYQHGASRIQGYQQEDVESGTDLKKRHSKSESIPDEGECEYGPIVSPETPFFHVDLVSAVNAAESGIGRVLE